MQRAEYHRQRYADRKSEAIRLLGGKCVNCGTIERLQFDHIKADRTNDSDMLCRLLRGRWSRVLEELKKCQLLCISCHAIKTGADRSAREPIHGLWGTYINRKCRCQDCVAANAEHTRQFRLKRIQLAA